MAIQDSFNLAQATSSQSYAYKCWYNYNYGGNTMNISSNDMSQITQTWSGQLSSWKATATKDDNQYEIVDDDFNAAKLAGKETAQEKAGGYSSGKTVKTGLRVVGADLAMGVGGVVAGFVAKNVAGNMGNRVAQYVTGKLVDKVGSNLATKTGTEVGTKVSNSAGGKNTAWIITAPLALATAIMYMAKKPNKDAKEACDALQDEMNNAQAALCEAQDYMSSSDDELVELSDEAAGYNEDANKNIEDKKAEYDMYKASYDALMAKIASGEPLTQEEQALLNEMITLLQELGVNITELTEETTDTVTEIYEEMEGYQENFDTAAETMAEVEGLTDYAESFDTASQIMCYVEAGAQGLNAASGAQAAYQAASVASSNIFLAWAWAFAAMGAAGSVMSGIGVGEQISWAGSIGTEIDMRKDTQDMNTDSMDQYSEYIDNYDGYMEGVEDLELEIPEDMVFPEEGNGDDSGEGLSPVAPASSSGSSQEPNKDEDEEK